jgi:outer membrane protein assembly factor BamB
VRNLLARADPGLTGLWIAGALALGLLAGCAYVILGAALSHARLQQAVAAPLVAPAQSPPAPVLRRARRPAPPEPDGLLTFRGNPSRSFYGLGPVPRTAPQVFWRYPAAGGMCMPSTDESGTKVWCGVGWTGQANVVPRASGAPELRFGAFDGAYHFLDAGTGTELRPSLPTGDLAKGSASSDPDGYPLYYGGSRDNRLRVIALDRPEPTVLWSLDAYQTGRPVVWNDDWDGAPLVLGDYLVEGGENSWLYVIRLHRGYDAAGRVSVDPKVVASVPSWDAQLERVRSDKAFSIENSVAFRDGVVYFANSAGLVQGWDISDVLAGGSKTRRVFRFWTGDDTDASVVVDPAGYLYVASELEKFDERSARVGQLLKLDPRKPRAPLVWSVPVRELGFGSKGGIWSTPALDRELVYVATNAGGVLGVERATGRVRWRLPLPGPTWSSPVVVDGVLLEGDCSGVLHAYDVRNQRRAPAELWQVSLGGCIEATPSVWKGRIYLGTRGGAMYALG